MSELPEPALFYLATCERILAGGVQEGVESLSPIERVIFRSHVFDCEEQMGSLSQFFYNIRGSSEIAEQTASALETIGTPQTAALLRSVAAVICHPDSGSFVGTWRGCLAQVDPQGCLNTSIEQLPKLGESVADALETFILTHRSELEHPVT